MFCKECGKEINDKASVCVHCGVAVSSPASGAEAGKSGLAYILLGVFLGSLGIHNFYAGYTNKAVAQLVLGLCGFLTCGISSLAAYIWAIVEICTVKQDANGVPFTKQ